VDAKEGKPCGEDETRDKSEAYGERKDEDGTREYSRHGHHRKRPI
jgi:hypothetical protein